MRKTFFFLLVVIVQLACSHDKSSVKPSLTRNDSISQIIDSIVGDYRVLVIKDSLPGIGSIQSDTIGIDTINVAKIGNDSIEISEHSFSFYDDQPLTQPSCYFTYADHSVFPPLNCEATFYINIDSISASIGYGLFEWGSYLKYQGRKIPK